MSALWKDEKDKGGRRDVTVSLSAEIVETLQSFCREKGIPPDLVVERALIEYFREGEMCH
jgi:hypothetical protein